MRMQRMRCSFHWIIQCELLGRMSLNWVSAFWVCRALFISHTQHCWFGQYALSSKRVALLNLTYIHTKLFVHANTELYFFSLSIHDRTKRCVCIQVKSFLTLILSSIYCNNNFEIWFHSKCLVLDKCVFFVRALRRIAYDFVLRNIKELYYSASQCQITEAFRLCAYTHLVNNNNDNDKLKRGTEKEREWERNKIRERRRKFQCDAHWQLHMNNVECCELMLLQTKLNVNSDNVCIFLWT